MPLGLGFMRCESEKSNFGILLGYKQELDPKLREKQVFFCPENMKFPRTGEMSLQSREHLAIKEQLSDAFLKIPLLRVGMF